MDSGKMNFVAFAVFLSLLPQSLCDPVLGAISLNSGVFDKIISKHKAVLVKFDETYPYGGKQDTFKEVAKATISSVDALVADVQVADYGDKDNMDLAEKFSIPTKKEELPVYLLFLQDQEEPIRYTGDPLNADDIKKFLMKESGLWLGLPACIELFDKIVKDFMSASSEEKAGLLKKAEEEAENVQLESHKISVDMYVKTMKKIMEKGNNFIDAETQRLERLQSGKLSDKKKDQLRDRLNILSSFSMNVPRDEL